MIKFPEGTTHFLPSEGGMSFWIIPPAGQEDGTGMFWENGMWVTSEIGDQFVATLRPVSTPSHHWTEDPHAGQYDGERAQLAMGNLTDDELANGAFMNYDQPMNIAALLSKEPGYHPPIAWMTAVKDRIRWLSRSLDKALADRRAGTPLLKGLAKRIQAVQSGELDIHAMDQLLADTLHLATTPIPGGLEVRAMGEANTYAVLKDGDWLANVRMNGQMTELQQIALIQAALGNSLERTEPWGEHDIIPLGEGSITGEAYRRGVEAGRRQAARAWKEDAGNWGDALNAAGWKFTDVCPEQSALLFNNCKQALREAIFAYADKVVESLKGVDAPEAVYLPPRMTEQREIEELLGRFGVYGAVPTGVATQIYNAALEHVSELNGKLADLPLRLVADVTGGAIHAVYAELPTEVIFISEDSDDIAALAERLSDAEMYRNPEDKVVAAWEEASSGGVDAEMVEHYFSQRT